MTTIEFREPRRRDRAIRDEGWIEDLLTRAPFGVLALVSKEGPKAVPNLFVFDRSRRAIYLHAARTGETRETLESRPKVSFCVAEMGRLLPADAAVHFSVEFGSVVAEGEAVIVEDPAEATAALDHLMRKLAPHLEPGRDYRSIEGRDLDRTSVLRIDVERWSAKRNRSDSADAFVYTPPETPPGIGETSSVDPESQP